MDPKGRDGLDEDKASKSTERLRTRQKELISLISENMLQFRQWGKGA
jgi:hypothetical protein